MGNAEDLKTLFGIDLFEGLEAGDVEFVRLTFHRRHEHNDGEVDQTYLDDSEDTSVRSKQSLRETSDSVFRTTEPILRMAGYRLTPRHHCWRGLDLNQRPLGYEPNLKFKVR